MVDILTMTESELCNEVKRLQLLLFGLRDKLKHELNEAKLCLVDFNGSNPDHRQACERIRKAEFYIESTIERMKNPV